MYSTASATRQRSCAWYIFLRPQPGACGAGATATNSLREPKGWPGRFRTTKTRSSHGAGGVRGTDLWNVGRWTQVYCGLILAALTTLRHFSVSSAMSLPKSLEEPASTV